MLVGLAWIFSTVSIVLVARLGFFGGLSSRLGQMILLISAVAWLGTGYYMWSVQRQKAIAAGFESSQDQRDAHSAGFADAETCKAEKLRRSSQSQN